MIFGKDHISNEIEIKSKLGVVFDENHFPDIFTPMEIGKYMAGIYSGWEWATYRQFLEKFELTKRQENQRFFKRNESQNLLLLSPSLTRPSYWNFGRSNEWT